MVKGRIQVFTSSTDKNPHAGSNREISASIMGSEQHYLEYISPGTSQYYFSTLGVELDNEFVFTPRVLDMDGAVIG